MFPKQKMGFFFEAQKGLDEMFGRPRFLAHSDRMHHLFQKSFQTLQNDPDPLFR